VREFDLDEAMVRSGASLTVVAADPAGTAPRARLRLFRGAPLGPDPAPQATVELVLQLPEIPPSGGTIVTAFLPTDAVGNPIGSLEAPARPRPGWSGSGSPGSFPLARRVPCQGEAHPGEVCIRGGAYWMGNRTLTGLPGKWSANVERLVVVSPFWIDAAEVTVEAFRAAAIPGAFTWSGTYENDPLAPTNACTFTAAPDPSHDLLPVNCVSQDAAIGFCAAKGAMLPTEGQFEFVAGDFASRLHPWGVDEPGCDDAVWGRSNIVPHAPGDVSPCMPPDEIALPLALVRADGTTRPGRDRVEVDDGTVFDLAGNLTEWTRDLFNEPWEACWNRAGSQVFVDPVCLTEGEEGHAYATRGGIWFGPSYLTRAAARFAQQPAQAIQTGIRCVRPANAP
jgi:formylglycine-generating enzyme required for sulfatase activity